MGAAVGSTTSMKFSPTWTALRRYSNEIGVCSKVTSTLLVVPSGLGTV